MKKLIILLIIAANPWTTFAQVHFEQGLTWQQVKDKAKKEMKYIFVDCYATWCGPCKQMDQEVYPDAAIGKIMNQIFVCVKVQMDSTKNDNQDVKGWYADAKLIAKENNITAYPSSLFFSQEGKLIHKYIGYNSPLEFLMQALKAKDPEKQEYVLLDKFNTGGLPDSMVPLLIKGLQNSGEDGAAKEVARKYIHEYLLKLPDELLYKKDNVTLMSKYLENSSDKVFELFYNHGDQIDKNSSKGLAATVVGNIITMEDIYPKLWHNRKLKEPISANPDWVAISNGIAKKYNKTYADVTILPAKIKWYQQTKEWPALIDAELENIQKNGVDVQGRLLDKWVNPVNDILYSYVFMHSNNPEIIKKAISYGKMIVESNPEEPDGIDTYANLLYKNGQKKEAIGFETKAIELKRKAVKELEKKYNGNEAALKGDYFKSKTDELKGLEDTLRKMKEGKPTWSND